MTQPVATSAPPLVSVLVPCFNHARYIEACLDSLLVDGYPNLELVLIDDGSGDETFAIAERWAASNTGKLSGGTRLSRQANRGLVPTLNTLLRSARGEYFALLASDDYLLHGGIDARVGYLQRRPDHLAVFADAIGIDEDGELIADSMLDHFRASRIALRCERTRNIELISKWVMPGPVYLARREVIDRIGEYDEHFGFEDRDYYLRLIAAQALGYVDVTVAAYRVPRVRDPHRYRKFKQDRHRIEQKLLPQFRGIERLALAAGIRRNQRPAKNSVSLLKWWWSGIPGVFVRRLRKLNRRLARLLLNAEKSRR